MRVTVFVVICLIVIGFFLIINANRNDQGGFVVDPSPPPSPPPTPEQRRWDSNVEFVKGNGYKLLSVEESRRWLKEHSSETDDYAVRATDPDGNRRVFLPKAPLPSPDDNYLSVTESIKWLERRG